MGNEIYKDQNFLSYSKQTKKRIEKFIAFFNIYKNPGTISDVCCGNKYIGKKVKANFFYDFYPIDDEVKRCDLLNYQNNVLPADNVLLIHALEHFEFPTFILQTINKKFLTQNGRLFIVCPNPYYNNEFKPFDVTIGHIGIITSEYIKIYARLTNFNVKMIVENNMDKGYEDYFFILEKNETFFKL